MLFLKFSHYFKVCINISQHYSMMNRVIKLPETVRLMTNLDKTQFVTNVKLPVLNVDIKNLNKIKPIVKSHVIKIRQFKPVQNLGLLDQHLSIILNPSIQNWSDLSATERDALEKLLINEHHFSSYNFTLTYDNYSAEDIFKAVLPEDIEGFSSFSQIGHIVHVNLREHLEPYKNLIGEVLLDKIANAKTIVNKTAIIDNTYRNFKMELLCGSNETMVNIKENSCKFEFDFSKVYWNSRLGTEHERIVKIINSDNVVFDVFAGIGPFAVPVAKKGCLVFANDLNPDSFKWLNHNMKINKIKTETFTTFNKDGRDFILNDLKLNIIKYINKKNVVIIMNLPALAVDFLSAFRGLFNESEVGRIDSSITVYVYCFAKGENPMEIAKNLVLKNLGFHVENKITNIFRVRTVSNFKEMMRVTLTLDESILFKNDTKRKHSPSLVEISESSKKNRDGEEQEQQQTIERL